MAITINGSGITSSEILDGTLTEADWGGNQLSHRNLIINGDMQINQRGTTSGITSGYFVDRWQLSGCSTSSTLSSSLPSGFGAGISISATSGNPIAFQRIESNNCSHLSGQSVTLSFYAKNISNATTLYSSLAYANSADNFGATTTISEQNLGTLTSDWVKYSYTWTSLPSGSTNGLSVNILCAGSGTFSMGITGVQLEVGSVATPFEHRSYGEELARCQRYYYTTGNERWWMHPIQLNAGNGYRRAMIPYPVTMRTVPTVSGTITNPGTGSGFDGPQWEGISHAAVFANGVSDSVNTYMDSFEADAEL